MEAATGGHILREVEEVSLEEVLDTLRASTTQATSKDPVKLTYVTAIDQVAARHFRATQAPALSISGRHLPMLYKISSTLVSPPHQFTLLVIDLDGHFDATRLSCTEEDASHVYVQQFPRKTHGPGDGTEDDEASMNISAEQIRDLVSKTDDLFLYGAGTVSSASRVRWGTIVVGGLGAGDVTSGWKGWLRVERESIRGFTLGTSVEDALKRRSARQNAVDAAEWLAESPWGSCAFSEEVGYS